jgi:hypothetical protein
LKRLPFVFLLHDHTHLTPIDDVAKEAGVDLQWVKENLVSHGIPQSSGTTAKGNRFHDDKSTWTSMMRAGGPTSVDNNRATLESQANRNNKANVRGVVQS